MAINLLSLKPNVVSRDLSGYITLLYGPPKVGKTTFGSKMPKPLLLAAEKGYSAIPGIVAQDIATWGQLKEVVRELKKPEVKEAFSSIIVDTVDLMSDFCQKYICNRLGIETMGEGGWSNNSWSAYKKEFEETFRTLAQLGYSIVFLSHDREKTIKPQNGIEYQQIGSSMQSSALAIIENMADIIGYAHIKVDENGNSRRVLTLRSLDNSVRCGSRFKYMAPEIEFSYEALTKALNDAIDKEANENNNQYVTNERKEVAPVIEYDYDALMSEFSSIAGDLMSKNQALYGPKITQIVNKYLGKGKKIADTTPEQAEFVYLIINEIKSDLTTQG